MPVVADLDPSMVRARDVFAQLQKEKSWTLHDLGVAMGYEGDTARKAAFQFLGVKVPRIDTLRKFASAVGIPLAELVAEVKPAKPKPERK